METLDEHGWVYDFSQPKIGSLLFEPSMLSEDEFLGHLLDIDGHIPHDAKRMRKIDNRQCRTHMLIAEAFAFGYQMGKKLGREDKK